jgi:hypothetical protein
MGRKARIHMFSLNLSEALRERRESDGSTAREPNATDGDCTRATQCCSLRQAASSIELLNTAKAALSIELRANYRITEKSIGPEGLSPADGIIACDNLADDLGKSQPQSSIKPKKVSVLRD